MRSPVKRLAALQASAEQRLSAAASRRSAADRMPSFAQHVLNEAVKIIDIWIDFANPSLAVKQKQPRQAIHPPRPCNRSLKPQTGLAMLRPSHLIVPTVSAVGVALVSAIFIPPATSNFAYGVATPTPTSEFVSVVIVPAASSIKIPVPL